MVTVPTSGKLTMTVKHHTAEPRFSQAVVLHMHIALHRWIAERFWLRCFRSIFENKGSKSREEAGKGQAGAAEDSAPASWGLKGKGNRKAESFFQVSEFILEYPTYNNLEYRGMHTHAAKVLKEVLKQVREAEHEAEVAPPRKGAGTEAAAKQQEMMEEARWMAPTADSETGATLSFVLVVQGEEFVELQPQTWDMDNQEERIDADLLFTGDEFLCPNQVQIMAKDARGSARQQARSLQPLPVPALLQHRTLWHLPKTGIVTVQRARLRRDHTNKPYSQAVAQLITALKQV